MGVAEVVKRGVEGLESWSLSDLPESVVRVVSSEPAGESEKVSVHRSRIRTTGEAGRGDYENLSVDSQLRAWWRPGLMPSAEPRVKKTN